MTIGERMKERRKELGMNAEYVAEKLGVSPATIYRYENGEIEKIPGNILDLISKVLRTTPAFLMGWEKNGSLKLGEIISRFRTDNGLSIQQFADRCGLEADLVTILEKGRNPLSGRPVAPSKDTIKKLCAGMGISVHDLFSIMDVQDWIESVFDVEQDPADRELLDILDELRSREDMRMLFKLARGASPDDVRRAAAIIEALRKQD